MDSWTDYFIVMMAAVSLAVLMIVSVHLVIGPVADWFGKRYGYAAEQAAALTLIFAFIAILFGIVTAINIYA